MEYNEHNLTEPPAKKVKLNSPVPNCGGEYENYMDARKPYLLNPFTLAICITDML